MSHLTTWEDMGCLVKRLPGIWEILGRVKKNSYSLQLFSFGHKGAWDHPNGSRNEDFRRFAMNFIFEFAKIG